MLQIAPDVTIETTYPPVTVGAALTEAGWVCIDTPPMPRDAQAWRAALAEVSARPVRYLIHTDHHRDRILGSAWFDCPIVTHHAAAQHLLSLKPPFISQAAEEMSSNDNQLVEIASLKLNPPQVSYSGSLSIFCGDQEIRLIEQPGPALGVTWVALPEARVLFVGETVVLERHPHLAEATVKGWLEALALLQSETYAGWILVPGRGAPLDGAAAQPLIDYLQAAQRGVADLMAAGRSRSELGTLAPDLLKRFPVPAKEREETQRRIRAGLETLYDELRASGDPPRID